LLPLDYQQVTLHCIQSALPSELTSILISALCHFNLLLKEISVILAPFVQT
jgi:hypothetical protein